jgi:hypothetical protein
VVSGRPHCPACLVFPAAVCFLKATGSTVTVGVLYAGQVAGLGEDEGQDRKERALTFARDNTRITSSSKNASAFFRSIKQSGSDMSQLVT